MSNSFAFQHLGSALLFNGCILFRPYASRNKIAVADSRRSTWNRIQPSWAWLLSFLLYSPTPLCAFLPAPRALPAASVGQHRPPHQSSIITRWPKFALHTVVTSSAGAVWIGCLTAGQTLVELIWSNLYVLWICIRSPASLFLNKYDSQRPLVSKYSENSSEIFSIQKY